MERVVKAKKVIIDMEKLHVLRSGKKERTEKEIFGFLGLFFGGRGGFGGFVCPFCRFRLFFFVFGIGGTVIKKFAIIRKVKERVGMKMK
jgi:hypothetical protein